MVRTEVRRPGEPLVTINYNLYAGRGRWLVYDIVVDGISLVHNYRATFAEQISRSGLPELIRSLDAKNRQALPEDSAELIRKRALRACQ